MANFVLVPGATLGGWCWKQAVKELQKYGHQVFTPTMTGLGERRHLAHAGIDLEVHIVDLMNFILWNDVQDAILVGHNYAGMLITAVADRLPASIRELVYLDGMLPFNGETVCDLMGDDFTAYCLRAATTAGDGWQLPIGKEEDYAIKDPKLSKWFMAHVTPHPIKTFIRPILLKHNILNSFPCSYIACLQSKAMLTVHKRAKQAGLTYYELQADHFPMLTNADLVSELLHSIAEKSVG